MHVLFVLLPAGTAPATLLDGPPGDLRVRVYPPADSPAHLRSLVRTARDPLATRWRRGMVLAIGAGAALGLLTNGVLAGAFGMFGGLVEIAVPLGAAVGAFLGAFTATMTGTERPIDELHPLLVRVRPGQVLLQVAGAPNAVAAICSRAAELGLPMATWRS